VRNSFGSSARPARPNICRLIILMWLTRPSTGPEFQVVVRPAVTASRSDCKPLAKDVRPGKSSARTAAIHWQELAFQLGDHVTEGTDVARCGAQFRALLQYGFQPWLVVFGQRVRVSGQPSGDLVDGGRCRRGHSAARFSALSPDLGRCHGCCVFVRAVHAPSRGADERVERTSLLVPPAEIAGLPCPSREPPGSVAPSSRGGV
jgi:hypothetical protein